MKNVEIILDALMCVLWMTTYTLVFIGTVKYKYPLISPITQLIIAPLEFVIAYFFIAGNPNGFDYISFAYLYWSVIEIAIISAIFKIKFIKKKHMLVYILLLLINTVLMIYLVAIKGYMLFFNYFNAFLGVLFWFVFIQRKDFPMKPIALVAFVTKFLADIIAIPVYIGDGGFLINFICISLPILDFMFIPTYFYKRCKMQV